MLISLLDLLDAVFCLVMSLNVLHYIALCALFCTTRLLFTYVYRSQPVASWIMLCLQVKLHSNAPRQACCP